MQQEEQLYSTVSLLPYLELEELDVSGLQLVGAAAAAAASAAAAATGQKGCMETVLLPLSHLRHAQRLFQDRSVQSQAAS